MEHWQVGDRVQVSLPYGDDGLTVLLGEVVRIQDPGPLKDKSTVKVRFDDPLVYGGLGVAWMNPMTLSRLGDPPGLPERFYE